MKRDSKPAKASPALQRRRKAAAKVALEDIGLVNLTVGRFRSTGISRGNVERLHEIRRLLGIGMTAEEVALYCASEWGMAQETVDRALQIVRDRWAIHEAEEAPHLRAQYRRTLQIVLQSSVVEGGRGTAHAAAHNRNAIKCLDQLCRLSGLYEPERVIITHTVPTMDEVQKATADLHDIMKLIDARSVETPDPATQH